MKEKSSSTKACLSCGKFLKGRVDKKFCDDYCRSNYNNRLNSRRSQYIRRINTILKKNRGILEELLAGFSATVTVNRSRLESRGFNFGFFTNTYTNPNGAVYFFCYEYGYLRLDNERLLLVKQKARPAGRPGV